MCIFTGPHVGVADTRIFARFTRERRQLLAYEMSYTSAGEMAMVLPLPIGGENMGRAPVRFISLAGIPDFFDQLSGIVESPLKEFDTLSAGGGGPPLETLAVHEVGAFDASYVPSPADFARLDARFRLADELLGRLAQYKDYGFAVFKLRETGPDLKRVHPMALDFSTRLSGEVFVPTVHVHDGRVHERAWFDHLVFVQGRHCVVQLLESHTNAGYVDGKSIRELRGEEFHKAASQLLSLQETITDHRGRYVGHDWKLQRAAAAADDRYGSAQRIGSAEGYFWSYEAHRKPGSMESDPGYGHDERWLKLAPYLDLESTLHAIGFSGMLPNQDTLIRVA